MMEPIGHYCHKISIQLNGVWQLHTWPVTPQPVTGRLLGVLQPYGLGPWPGAGALLLANWSLTYKYVGPFWSSQLLIQKMFISYRMGFIFSGATNEWCTTTCAPSTQQLIISPWFLCMCERYPMPPWHYFFELSPCLCVSEKYSELQDQCVAVNVVRLM